VTINAVGEDITGTQRALLADVVVAGNGEVKGPHHAPVLPLTSERWQPDVSDILGADLARRLDNHGVLKKDVWEGTLPRQVRTNE